MKRVADLFEEVSNHFDNDFTFNHKKAVKAAKLYELLEKKYGWNKAITIFSKSKKNFGSVAFYKANPILFVSFEFNPTNESYNHLRSAFIIGAANYNYCYRVLTNYLNKYESNSN